MDIAGFFWDDLNVAALFDPNLAGMTQSLAANFAVVMAVVFLYMLALEGRLDKGSWRWNVIIGIGFGVMAVVSMLFPIQVRPGIFSDAKFVLAVIAASYGGPLAGIITVVIALAFRWTLGGVGLVAAAPVLLASWLLGGLFSRISSPTLERGRRTVHFLVLGYVLWIFQLLGVFLFLFFWDWNVVKVLMVDLSVPAILIFPPMIVLMGLSLDFIDSRHHISVLQVKTASDLEKRNLEMRVLHKVFHHELRTPVVTLQGFLQELRDDVLAGRYSAVSDDVEYLQKATDRMAEMLDALSMLHHAGEKSDQEVHSQLSTVVDILVRRWPSLRREAFVDAEVSIALEPLVDVLSFVVDNAFKFSAPNSNPDVVISSLREDKGMRIVVQDNGIGIPLQYLDRVFCLFEKLDVKSPGVGVGLTIAERIVKTYNGRIWAESLADTKGCRLSIWIPLAE